MYGTFQIIGLIIFILLFTGVIVYVVKLDRKICDEMSALPLLSTEPEVFKETENG